VDVFLSLVVGLALIAVIIAANGYFVAQEFAFMAVDRSRLRARAEEGDKAAERALAITGRTSFMLSGAQVGITVTGLLVGYVAEPLVGSAVGEVLGGAGVPAATGIAIGTIGVLVVATFVQMLFGELYPKNLAIAAPLPMARGLATSTTWYLRLFGWLVWIFDQASNALLRLVRIEPVHDVEHSANPRDLQRIVSLSRAAGELPDELSLLLDRLLDFPERDVEHALVPRSRVDVLDESTTVEEVRSAMMDAGHSRYPVLTADGEILGVVHVDDVLDVRIPDDVDAEAPVTRVMRPVTVVPTLMRLPDALAEIVRDGGQLACVVDEYDSFAGIVTVEDLVEEVVGEIADEHDTDEEPPLVPESPGGPLRVHGDAPLDEVAREIGHAVPRGDFETLAGLLLAEHGRLVEAGTVVEVRLPDDPAAMALDDDHPVRVLRAEVLEVGRHVPSLVRLEVVEVPAGADHDGGPDRQASTSEPEEVQS
jgi:CBS domain containing-hemolysin-like protein